MSLSTMPPKADQPSTSALPRLSTSAIWSDAYRRGRFPEPEPLSPGTTLSMPPLSATAVSPLTRLEPLHVNNQAGADRAIIDRLNRRNSIIDSLNRRNSTYLTGPPPSSTPPPLASPLSSAFNRMSVANNAYAPNSSLRLSQAVDRPGPVRPVPAGAAASTPIGERRSSANLDARQAHHIFVTSVAARRSSTTSNAAAAAAASSGGQSNGSGGALSSKVNINALVRPKLKSRGVFAMERTFDLNQMRNAIPGPPRRVSLAPPDMASNVPLQSPTGPRRSSRLRHSGGIPEIVHVADTKKSNSTTARVDWRLARACLPILAALMASGHLRDGDCVDLPLPQPEAWAQTVFYLGSTGPEVLTDAMRKNIVYLGGKV